MNTEENNVKKLCFGYWQKVWYVLIYASCPRGRLNGIARASPAGRDQRSIRKNRKNGSWQTGEDVLRYSSCCESGNEQNTGSEANLERAFESLKKLEKRTWQRAEDVVNWISCAERGLVVSGRKSLKRNEKSSWQTASSVIQSKGCCESGADRGWELCQGFEKVEKLRKKFLTNAWSCDKIKKFEANESELKTSLYLVNWITWRRTN